MTTPTDRVRAALEEASNRLQFSAMARSGDPKQVSEMQVEAAMAGLLQGVLRELDGMVLVPVEPTEEQILKAFPNTSWPIDQLKEIYRAFHAPYVEGEKE